MDKEYILYFLFGLVMIGIAIYCKFHQKNMSVNANPAWPIEGQKKFCVLYFFSFGLLIIVETVFLIVFQSSESIGLALVPLIVFFILMMLWLSWKFIFSQVEKWRVIMLVVISVLTVAGIALVVYYICTFEPSKEVEVANEMDDRAINDVALDCFLFALVGLARCLLMIFRPEKTRIFKNLTEEQRAKADLAGLQKTCATTYFLWFAILAAFGVIAIYVKMSVWCILIPAVAFLPISIVTRRRMKVYLGKV